MPSCCFFVQAIDKFGETCCCIDSRLVALEQIFDKTDMSGLEIQETQHVLEDHKKMWFSVRDDLESAQNTGNTRLKFMKVRSHWRFLFGKKKKNPHGI